MAGRKIYPPKTPPKATAPGKLGTLHAFLNSPSAPDNRLDSPEALTGWLHSQGLLTDVDAIGEAAWRDALQLRDDLRDLLRLNSGKRCSPEALRRLNEPAERRYRVRIEPNGTVRRTLLLPTNWPGVRLHLLDLVLTAITEREWSRLRFCDNETCPWVLYDTSGNRTGRWCRPRCGNAQAKRKSRGRRR